MSHPHPDEPDSVFSNGGDAKSRLLFPGGGVLRSLAGRVGQALVVSGGPARAVVSAVEKRGQRGSFAFGPFCAVIGRSGFARPGGKREGDGATPSGTFRLEGAFGYAPTLETAMPYRRIEENDVWVIDPASPDYNEWRRKGETCASSFEEMRRPDGLYEVGIVIGYNRQPAERGLGSAIFFHVWRDRGTPTSGCVAMAKEDLLAVLSWLDPEKSPVAILGIIG